MNKSSTTLSQHLHQVVSLINASQINQANTACDQLLLNYSENADVHHLKALCLKQLNQIDKAIGHFHQSIKLEPRQPIVLTNFANLLFQAGHLKDAQTYYQRALDIFPEHHEASLNLARLYFNQKQYNKALEIADQLILSKQKLEAAHSLKGDCLKHLKKIEQSIESYNNALSINPRSFFALHNKGAALRSINRSDEAIDCFSKLEASGVQLPELQFNLGCAYYDLDAFDKAEDYLQKALNLKPDYIEAHQALNKLYWESHRDDKFLTSYEKSLAKMPHAINLWIDYSSALTLASKSEQAKMVLQRARKLAGDQPNILHSLGVLHLKDGDIETSEKLIIKARDNAPNNTRFLIDLAQIKIKQGNYDFALQQLERAHDIEPLNQEIWAYKGICWRLLSDERYHWLFDFDKLVDASFLPTPNGYDNTEHFIDELAKFLTKLHKTTREPLDQSVRGGTQTVGHLLYNSAPIIQDFKKSLQQRVENYLINLPDDDTHPFLNRKTKQFVFDGCWSVLLKSGGFHTNHVHPYGWLSGPTYIKVPQMISPTDINKSGWVKFGETAMDLGERENIGLSVCPQPGLSVLFPSYFWHGTFPFESDEQRMTAPCDIEPNDQ